MEAHNAARITEIKEFLAETRISSSLFKDIVGHFKTAMKHSSAFDETLILSRLPNRIRDELLLYIHRQSLTTIPLFRYITNNSVKLYLLKRMSFQVVDVGRSILREDDVGDEIVFVMKGMSCCTFTMFMYFVHYFHYLLLEYFYPPFTLFRCDMTSYAHLTIALHTKQHFFTILE